MIVSHNVLSGVMERGFTLLRGFLPTCSTQQALSVIGVVDLVEGLAPVQNLVPTAASHAPPNTYSGNFGMGDFPLHTDLAHWSIPPRFLALRCVKGSATVATRVLDGRQLMERFGLTTLRRTLGQSRRPIRDRKQLLPLCERVAGGVGYCLRWDSIFLRPAGDMASTTFEQISAYLAKVQVEEIQLLDPGDTLVIDNWRCLHGRGAVSDGSVQRKVERAYLRSIT